MLGGRISKYIVLVRWWRGEGVMLSVWWLYMVVMVFGVVLLGIRWWRGRGEVVMLSALLIQLDNRHQREIA